MLTSLKIFSVKSNGHHVMAAQNAKWAVMPSVLSTKNGALRMMSKNACARTRRLQSMPLSERLDCTGSIEMDLPGAIVLFLGITGGRSLDGESYEIEQGTEESGEK